jgi:hypothetical protein
VATETTIPGRASPSSLAWPTSSLKQPEHASRHSHRARLSGLGHPSATGLIGRRSDQHRPLTAKDRQGPGEHGLI